MSVGQQNGGPGRQDAATAQGGAERPVDWNELKDEVGEIAEAAVGRGRHFLDSARLQAVDYADQRKNDVAGSVADLARSLRESCSAFDDRPNIRAFVDSAAEGLDQLADTIRDRSFGDIYEDVEDIMRRRPATVAAVTMTAGFLLSRFIRASAENIRDAQRRSPAGARQASRRPASGGQAAQRRA